MKRLASNGSAILRQHSLRFTSTTTSCFVPTRHSSLSAIHRGLRQSERVQYGATRPRRDSSENYGSRNRNDNRTNKALDGISSYRQESKLRKKLDRKQQEDELDDGGRQTRRKRFLDPTTSFGKSSLVYQLKHGALKDVVDPDQLQQPVRAAPRQRTEGDRRTGRRQYDQTTSKFDEAFQQRHPRRDTEPSDRAWGRKEGERRTTRRQYDQTTSNFDEAFQQRHRRDTERSDRGWGQAESSSSSSRPKMMPLAIKYTTAASQFLYGRSVVMAALEQSRRKLYNLYVYGGTNRIDSEYNTSMIRLAERQGVPVTIVPNEEQRLMDKMSMGRPHNGFVLETSPLPQLPIAGLGPLEETPFRLGFHIELAHQTREDEAINGLQTFIPRANNLTPRPLVLLLHEIVDPGNLGALLRTASYLGVDAVGITSRSSSTLTPVVLKSAAGAVEEITIFRVDSPTAFLEKSKEAGWKTYAAVAPPDRKLARMHGDKFVSIEAIEKSKPLDNHPCVLVLGNEGYGLPRQVKVAADYEVSVPRFIQSSCVDSLNVSVAAGLLCHAFVKEATTDAVKSSGKPVTAKVNEDEGAETPSRSQEQLF